MSIFNKKEKPDSEIPKEVISGTMAIIRSLNVFGGDDIKNAERIAREGKENLEDVIRKFNEQETKRNELINYLKSFGAYDERC